MKKPGSILLALNIIVFCMPVQPVSAIDQNVKPNIRNQGVAPRGPGSVINVPRVSMGMDYCVIQHPKMTTVQSGMFTENIYGQVYKADITEAPGSNPSLVAELGYGPVRTDPRSAVGWVFVKGTYNVQVGSNDEYMASFTAPSSGSYAYCWRFSLNGSNWTYADTDGVDPGRGLAFDPTKLGVLTVIP
jgi:hypothetical protein